jgi:leader peptidase (prepilin peptidase)/N-methyltransferase
MFFFVSTPAIAVSFLGTWFCKTVWFCDPSWICGRANPTPASAAEVIALTPWGYLFAGILGGVIGSFLNVVACRLPKGQSIVRPASHCMHCQKPIAPYDNIPIVSYLWLRGRCRHCKTRFSPGYALVEALMAALAVACLYHVRGQPISDAWIVVAHFVAELVFCATLLVVALIDLRTWIIPNVITYPAMGVFWGMAVSLQRLSWGEALAGLGLGFGGLAGLLLLYQYITGREGMGWGDAKLLGAIGAFLGPQALPVTVFLAAVQGLLAAVVLVLSGRSLAPSEPYLPLEESTDSETTAEAQNPTAQDPTAQDPTAQDPTAQDSTAQDSTAQDPTAQDPTAQDPTAQDPTAQDSTAQDPTAQDAKASSWRHVPVPFGPFLALAAVECLMIGDWLMTWLIGDLYR